MLTDIKRHPRTQNLRSVCTAVTAFQNAREPDLFGQGFDDTKNRGALGTRMCERCKRGLKSYFSNNFGKFGKVILVNTNKIS